MTRKLIEFLISVGVIPAEKADEARAEAKKMEDASGTPPAPAPNTGTPPTNIPAGFVPVSDVQRMIEEAMSPVNKRLEEDARARKTAEDALAERMKKEKEEKITAKLDTAEKEGRITSKEAREIWAKRLDTDFEGYSAALAELPANPAVNRKDGDGKKQETTTGERSTGGSGLTLLAGERLDQSKVFNDAVAAFGDTK